MKKEIEQEKHDSYRLQLEQVQSNDLETNANDQSKVIACYEANLCNCKSGN